MKFITEEEIRALYDKNSFNSYDLDNGYRLTPAARQFLIDRKVVIDKKEDQKSSKHVNNQDFKLLAVMLKILAIQLNDINTKLSKDIDSMARNILGANLNTIKEKNISAKNNYELFVNLDIEKIDNRAIRCLLDFMDSLESLDCVNNKEFSIIHDFVISQLLILFDKYYSENVNE